MDKKFKIFVIIAIVLLGIAIGVSTFLVLSMMGKDKEAVSESQAEVSKSKLVTINVGDPITCNVYEATGEQHIAKVSISLGVNEKSKQYKKFQKDFESSQVIIRDEIIQTIREQTYEMMSKTDAQTKLGDEIAARINKLLDTQVVEKVYFSEFFVQ